MLAVLANTTVTGRDVATANEENMLANIHVPKWHPQPSSRYSKQ